MRLQVEFRVSIADDYTDDQIQDWLEFELGAIGSAKIASGLDEIEAEPQSVRFCEVKR